MQRNNSSLTDDPTQSDELKSEDESKAEGGHRSLVDIIRSEGHIRGLIRPYLSDNDFLAAFNATNADELGQLLLRDEYLTLFKTIYGKGDDLVENVGRIEKVITHLLTTEVIDQLVTKKIQIPSTTSSLIYWLFYNEDPYRREIFKAFLRRVSSQALDKILCIRDHNCTLFDLIARDWMHIRTLIDFSYTGKFSVTSNEDVLDIIRSKVSSHAVKAALGLYAVQPVPNLLSREEEGYLEQMPIHTLLFEHLLKPSHDDHFHMPINYAARIIRQRLYAITTSKKFLRMMAPNAIFDAVRKHTLRTLYTVSLDKSGSIFNMFIQRAPFAFITSSLSADDSELADKNQQKFLARINNALHLKLNVEQHPRRYSNSSRFDIRIANEFFNFIVVSPVRLRSISAGITKEMTLLLQLGNNKQPRQEENAKKLKKLTEFVMNPQVWVAKKEKKFFQFCEEYVPGKLKNICLEELFAWATFLEKAGESTRITQENRKELRELRAKIYSEFANGCREKEPRKELFHQELLDLPGLLEKGNLEFLINGHRRPDPCKELSIEELFIWMKFLEKADEVADILDSGVRDELYVLRLKIYFELVYHRKGAQPSDEKERYISKMRMCGFALDSHVLLEKLGSDFTKEIADHCLADLRPEYQLQGIKHLYAAIQSASNKKEIEDETKFLLVKLTTILKLNIPVTNNDELLVAIENTLKSELDAITAAKANNVENKEDYDDRAILSRGTNNASDDLERGLEEEDDEKIILSKEERYERIISALELRIAQRLTLAIAADATHPPQSASSAAEHGNNVSYSSPSQHEHKHTQLSSSTSFTLFSKDHIKSINDEEGKTAHSAINPLFLALLHQFFKFYRKRHGEENALSILQIQFDLDDATLMEVVTKGYSTSIRTKIKDITPPLSLQPSERALLVNHATMQGFAVKEIERKGNCLYLAISDQLRRVESTEQYDHAALREMAATHLVEHKEHYHYTVEDENALRRGFENREWAGHEAIVALSRRLKKTIIILQANAAPVIVKQNRDLAINDILFLGFEGHHYQSLIPLNTGIDLELWKRITEAPLDRFDAALEASTPTLKMQR